MGGGSYSYSARSDRAASRGYNKVHKGNLGSVFKQQSLAKIHKDLDPNGVVVRESRDSEEHPESLAVLIGLDVTGSMGDVPAKLIKDGLPHMIQNIFDHGIEHPQVGFVCIGDHFTDRAPLQVGQFESSDELIDESLEKVWIEGHGGGNQGESYLLAWYHAGFRTEIDCYEKRGQKGILVTIGDEPCHVSVPGKVIADLYGGEPGKDFTAQELLEAAQEKYHVVHINIGSTYSGHREWTKDSWRKLLGENFIEAESHEDVPTIIAETVKRFYQGETTSGPNRENTQEEVSKTEPIL